MDHVRCIHRPLRRRGLTQLSQHTTHVGRMAGPIVTSSPGTGTVYCYAELAVSSLEIRLRLSLSVSAYT